MSDPYDREHIGLGETSAEDGATAARKPMRLAPIVLTLLLVVGFAAVAWYALDKVGQGRQDVATLEPPLIKAEAKPYKRKPDDPGGMRIPNQDKHIYERILPGPQTAEREKLLPPPEEPVGRPKPAVKPVMKSPPPTKPVPQAEQLKKPTDAAAALAQDAAPAETEPAAGGAGEKGEKMVDKLVGKLLEPAEKGPAKSTTTEQETTASPPAMEKPVQTAAAERPPAPAAETAAAATKPAANFRIQLAAFRKEALAKQAWQRLQKRHGEVLQPLEPHVTRAKVKDRGVYYRLQAGPFATVDAARGACKSLKSQKQDCLLVRIQ